MLSTKSKRVTKSTKAGREIRAALQEVIAAQESGRPLEEKLTARTYQLPEPPGQWGPIEVATLRKAMDASQAFFAAMAGVSPGLVQAWEQGKRTPDGGQRRLLDYMKADPIPCMKGVKARTTGVRSGAR